MSREKKNKRIADFFFEIGTMRKLPRIHRQTLLTDDVSDNIASHAYRVAIIGWFLAQEEEVDASKVVMMCLLHDMAEIRSNDHNWVHKRYVKIYDEEIRDDQLGDLPYPELGKIASEYDARESREAVVAKDADVLDQILLLREYEWQGNKEATIWLHGRESGEPYKLLSYLKTESAEHIGRAIYDGVPSDWSYHLATGVNR